MKTSRKLPRALAVAAAGAVSLFFLRGDAFANGPVLVINGAHTFASLASTDGDGNDAVFTVPIGLLLTPGASITCNDAGPSTASACPIRIVVAGDLTMQGASAILAENNASAGFGGSITIEVGGNVTLESGAILSSRKNAGTDRANAGDIFVTSGGVTVTGGVPVCGTPVGDLTVAAGALVTTDGAGEAGAISMYAGHAIAIEGTVRARGLTTTGRGGPITAASCGGLTTGAVSTVSSRGGGPGADLVSLEGISVAVAGLVESTGPGQELASGRNRCNEPGRPANSTACVEIASASTIEIAPTAEVNADTGFSAGTQGTGWIDILAPSDIAITGDSALPYAVHANQGLTNGHGGVIRAISFGGGIVALTGKAIQANSTIAGGKGGVVMIEATFSSVDLDAASVQAEGAIVGGGGQAGGQIFVDAFLGDIVGSAPGELNARGGPGSGNGEVFLNFCHVNGYTGASIPAAVPTQICAF